MSIVWPITLPIALRMGWRATAPAVTVRTQNDAGPAKVRRRFTTNVYVVEGDLVMTGTQLATFLAFFNDSLAGGALPFQWIVPWNGHPVDFRFREPPDLSALGPRNAGAEPYVVPVKLELLPWTEQFSNNPPPPPPRGQNDADSQFNNGGAGGTAWNQEDDPLDDYLLSNQFLSDFGAHVDPGIGTGSESMNGVVITNP